MHCTNSTTNKPINYNTFDNDLYIYTAPNDMHALYPSAAEVHIVSCKDTFNIT